MNKRIRNGLLVAAILLISGGAGAYLALEARTSEETAEGPPIRQVRTTVIVPGEVSRTIVAQGYVAARESVVLHAQAGGEVVYSLNGLRPGTPVTKGEVLLRLAAEDASNEVDLAETDLLRGLATLLANLDNSDSMSVRPKWAAFRGALASGALPELPVVASDRERLVLTGYGVIESYYALARARRDLAYHTIAAPISGVIREGTLHSGSMVLSGQQVASIIDPYHLETAVALTGEEIAYVRGGDGSVALMPAGGESPKLPGVIDRSGGFAERGTQMVDLYVRFENPEQLLQFLPGSYVEARFSGAAIEEALLIPRGLVNEDGTLSFLVEGRLRKYPVQIVGHRGEEAIVRGSGLRPGMELITTPIQIPVEGMELEKKSEESAP